MDNILQGDALTVLKTLPERSVQMCVTSPPYFGLRNYGVEGQIGMEETPELFVQRLVEVFREVRRVLKDDGTLWLNLGDSYGKQKQILGIPWRVAFALQADGWYLRQDIIWHKPNPMPESVTDRCTKAHEYMFLLSKSEHYYFDNEAIKEPAIYGLNGIDRRPPGIVRDRLYGYESKESELRGRTVTKTKNGITIRHPNGKHANEQQSSKTIVDKRNKRSVWTVPTKPYRGAHFATFPPDLIRPCIQSGAPVGCTVLDPFFGSGTTGQVAKQLCRHYLGIELNPEYIKLAENRLEALQLPLVA